VTDPVTFFFDQHIPAAVARGLRRRGVDVLTAQETARCGVTDLEQLQYAYQQRRVLVTFDDDFLVLASSGKEHAGIAFCSATKYTIGELIRVLLLVHQVLGPADMKNHVEFL
jgi:predicted nuclease of predicted toxin-antitoxin system